MSYRRFDEVAEFGCVAPIGSFEGTPQQLAQLVYDQLTTFPETHDQSDWINVCCTTACVSGWAQMFARGYVNTSNRAPKQIGRELLGLSAFDAHWLFHGTTNEQARHALKMLANGDPIDWDAVGHKHPYLTMEQMRQTVTAYCTPLVV